MELDHLLRPDVPWLETLAASPAEVADAAAALQRQGGGRVTARVLRGAKMRTTAALFDEFAAALQFPPYFGENFDALDECLTDLEWLPADAWLLAVLDAPRLLDTEDDPTRRLFWESLADAAHHWARSAKVFRVLLQCAPAEELLLRNHLPTSGRHAGPSRNSSP